MLREHQLTAAMGQTCNGYAPDEVADAAGNIVLNALRQKHPKLDDAEAQLEELVAGMKKALRTAHYDHNGHRNDRRIVLPPLRQLADS